MALKIGLIILYRCDACRKKKKCHDIFYRRVLVQGIYGYLFGIFCTKFISSVAPIFDSYCCFGTLKCLKFRNRVKNTNNRKNVCSIIFIT